VSDPALDIGSLLGTAAEQLHREGRGLSPAQQRAIADLSACRTEQLGGRIEQCSCCGQREFLYNSCRNRHCPKCQAGNRALWLEREASYLLPVEYHHLVFTLPQEVAELARDNPRLIYGLLFEAAAESVRQVAADPRYLGAQVGLTAVLHTWGQTLSLHPHLHILATGGGLSCNRQGEVDFEPVWKSCRPGFFLPVRVLSRLFRGKFLARLQLARSEGNLRLTGVCAGLSAEKTWSVWLTQRRSGEWVVYSKPPTAGAEVVLKYLARYTYRVAMSNRRLVRVDEQEVTFRYKDYRREEQEKEMTLSRVEFARRFLQHVLPRGFVRVRHYGLLGNRSREEKLAVCRRLLGQASREQPGEETVEGKEGEKGVRRLCPVCGRGPMEVVELLPAWPRQRRDSS
jgi:hypothetical protein